MNKKFHNYRKHVIITEDDSLEWTLSSSVSMFGLMSILVAYCSYCAVFTRDLLVAILVREMKTHRIYSYYDCRTLFTGFNHAKCHDHHTNDDSLPSQPKRINMELYIWKFNCI